MERNVTRQGLWNILYSSILFLHLMLILLTAGISSHRRSGSRRGFPTAIHFDSRRRRSHRRQVPKAAGFFGFPYYLVAMMGVR
jgi:hypothetical protein